MLRDIHELASRLARPETRAKEAARIACEAGAEAFLIFLHDAEIGALTPAPGFPQTLPGGPVWRAFLKKQPVPGATFTTELPFPDQDTLKPAQCFACGSVVFLLVGEASPLKIERFADTPLLPALLEAEAAQLASSGLVRGARDATQRATRLAGALDRARAEISKKAIELSAALSEAAHLNRELSRLNQTLEQRVEERSAELTEANEALRQAQKMEAVGQLTGGITHDFNNLLAGITGSLEVIERRLSQGRTEGIERFIKGAQTSAQRAATLTQRLLAFSRRQRLDPKPTDVNRLVFGMEDLIRRTAGHSIKVEVVGAAGLWPTMVDAAQLESALLNLAINARDAMPNGGQLTIETANKWLDGRAGLTRDLAPGQYISICVTDSGTGIPKDIIDRIFDPFFTTKPIGQGTGLGLSMIHGFVRQSGGQIRVYSESDQGTTMCLYLPRYAGELADVSDAPDPIIAEVGTGQTVLVIEDEPIVRMLIVEVLEEAGYVALEAEDGPSGLKILQSATKIDLLITDVGLPRGMNGRQVANAARVARPNLKVLFVTGFAENAAVGNGHLEPGMEVITKPFVTAELAHKITDMIEH